ncbi:hypothetical protein, partial [Stenotrophomonas maltophilia group sp. RNC7]|uniref:hypothetical protein n=1 Tax=Stenotrophomonas maltophilia group sp. RNC7 TaxID=3071467 RepID=UPI0027DFCEE8
MLKKTKNILLSFWKSSKGCEILEIYGIPTLIVFITIGLVNKTSINNFTQNFLESNLTIAALLAAFGVASVTIIMTSSSKNIEVAKTMLTARLNIN